MSKTPEELTNYLRQGLDKEFEQLLSYFVVEEEKRQQLIEFKDLITEGREYNKIVIKFIRMLRFAKLSAVRKGRN